MRDNWSEITNFDGKVEYPTSNNDGVGRMIGNATRWTEKKNSAKKFE